MIRKTVEYQCDDVTLKGHLVAPSTSTSQKLPAIVIAHAWRGLDDFAKHKAEELAGLGYIAFAADMYGNGITVKSDEEAAKLMRPLFFDRALLRKRINTALETLKKQPGVDIHSLGAIGFCFGGLTVIELFRSGAPLRGAVSFHGVLGSQLGDNQAKVLPTAKNIKGSLLMLHGDSDPLVSQEDIVNMKNDLTAANVDWQLHIYGQVAHAFTNPQAHDLEHGLVFNAKANKRAWQSMRNFFEEVFDKGFKKENEQ